MNLDLHDKVWCIRTTPPRRDRTQQDDATPPPPPPPPQLTPYERASMDMLAGITRLLERQSERPEKSHDEDVAERFRKKGLKEFAGTTDPLVAEEWIRSMETIYDYFSRGNRHFTVGGGRLRQSGPRPEGRLLRQPVLEGLTRSARTDSPRQVGRNKFRRNKAAAAATAFEERREAAT
ncbi:hypothetical protein F511_18435 [Dorcoceras hygrometricum]|uniref:Uncharacterized protein n=1 Tax=Dorcoceras hygrometricum TaxID=472368 RepID=A0A2Z7C2E6_9LAMI|nr:hypothetical protein F511_18435 [Dorcoceras hygrometricum]